MTDLYTDDLFKSDFYRALPIIYPVSRLVVDPERFIDDAEEPMSEHGMGVIYTRTSTGEKLRKIPSEEERSELLKEYYHPHHEKLTLAVKKEIKMNSCVLIVDCHSFSSTPLPHELDQSPDRPDICIGTDAYHSPLWLSKTVVALFIKEGFSVDVNRPFSGTIVPMIYYRRNPYVFSIMIELSRKLYVDETTGVKNKNYPCLEEKLIKILRKLRNRVEMKMKK